MAANSELLAVALVLFTCSLTGVLAVDFPTCQGEEASIEEYVDYISGVLSEASLPYWHGLIDEDHGGYIVERGAKFVVEQTRLVYVFSIMHLADIEAPGIDKYDAARTGVDFLLNHFKDTYYGGYYWGTDEAGNVTDDRKYLYGEAFALIAMSTYYRAFGEAWAKEEALGIFRTINEHMADRESSFGGWFEHCERDWTVITEGEGELGRNGVKTSNALLHWMESLTDLAETVEDTDVFAVLTQLLDKDILEFYPEDPLDAVSERDLDGNILITGEDDYGHLIEFDWVMLKAQIILGREPDWVKFDKYFDYVIAALDPATGGIIDDIGEVVWWRQSELLTAFSAYKFVQGTGRDEEVLKKLLDLIICHFIDRQDGAMYYALNEDLCVKDPSRSSKWKAGYHETRALTSFISFY